MPFLQSPSTAPSIEVAFCCDAGYLQPLTVAVTSLLSASGAPQRLRIWLITSPLADASAFDQVRQLAACAGARFALVEVPARPFADGALAVSEHLSVATYYRLMLPDLLPPSVRRLVYLDCDLIVRRPIEELWDFDLIGAPAAAVPNPRAFHFAQLGLRDEREYFNAGVMLLDLDCWRRENLHGRALTYARERGAALRCHDQDALNHVLGGRWRPLDLRWNQQFKFFQHPAYFLHVEPAALRRARRDPFIVHYTTNSKPWHYDNDHPWRWLFFRFLDETPFRGWRPAAPASWRQRFRRRTRALIPHPLRAPFWRYNLPPALRSLKHRLA